MTLLDPEGMIHDEGEEITSKIIKNGTQKENIAIASVNQETEGKKQ